MEEADTPVEPGEPAGYTDQDSVVQGGGGEHGDDGENRHGACWDLEGLGDVSVHGFGLLKGECALLSIGCD